MTERLVAVGDLAADLGDVLAMVLTSPRRGQTRELTTDEVVRRTLRFELERLVEAGMIVLGPSPEMWVGPSLAAVHKAILP